MDDLLLFTPAKKSHIAKLENLLKALLKNRHKISPKKSQLFRTEIQYIWFLIPLHLDLSLKSKSILVFYQIPGHMD